MIDAPSLPHLQAHHGDFARFRDVMIETSQGRFGGIWWGVWDQHVQPAPDACVLDLGCGPGLLLPMLRERLPEARLVGVEIQPVMLETAREVVAGCGAELVEADLAQPLPLPDGCADVVNLVMVFHEMAHPPPILDEAWRLLRPGGKMVLYDWVSRPLEDYLGGEDPTPARLEHFREHCLFAAGDLEFLARRVGFHTLEAVGRRGGRYVILVCEKPAPQAEAL